MHRFCMLFSGSLHNFPNQQYRIQDLMSAHCQHIVSTKKKVICWRAAPKLGRALIPYRYGVAPEVPAGPSAATPSAESLGTDD